MQPREAERRVEKHHHGIADRRKPDRGQKERKAIEQHRFQKKHSNCKALIRQPFFYNGIRIRYGGNHGFGLYEGFRPQRIIHYGFKPDGFRPDFPVGTPFFVRIADQGLLDFHHQLLYGLLAILGIQTHSAQKHKLLRL